MEEITERSVKHCIWLQIHWREPQMWYCLKRLNKISDFDHKCQDYDKEPCKRQEFLHSEVTLPLFDSLSMISLAIIKTPISWKN